MNTLVWHAFVCSPEAMGMPGQQYFAGTHLNPNVTWWSKSAPFFRYINRCQWMLQQGAFVADALYYYGDHIPNFTQLKKSDPARVLPGYDYDVITKETLQTRASVSSGKIVLPGGMSYRVLVLPDRNVISLPVLKKLKELAAAGATILGPMPAKAETLQNYPECDAQLAALADELWSGKVRSGRVIAGKSAREVLLADGVPPDCEFISSPALSVNPDFDYIHRRDGGTDIYFVANRAKQPIAARCAFRVAGKAPELWNPVTGEHELAAGFEEKDHRTTTVPLDFDPCGSWFVVFRTSARSQDALPKGNNPGSHLLQEISGPWTVHFDPKWGGPEAAVFDSLVSWTNHSEAGIKYYSGTATYEKTFALPSSALAVKGSAIFLDLGSVRELAEIKVNGKSCGIVWCPPFRTSITSALRPGTNHLEIEVVNFWPNRIIGDAALPQAERRTKTNIRKLTAKTPLMESGLLGPVRILARE
jgi:hypothetical protein